MRLRSTPSVASMAEPIRTTDRRGGARCLVLLVALLAGCAAAPLRPTVATVWQPSPNFDERRPEYVILHHTSNATAEPALRTLTRRESQVSAHFLVVRDGTIVQLVDERARAWHAGASLWGDSHDINSASLGIELDNDGAEAYPEAQVKATLALLADLSRRYRIPTANYLGHADVAPRRKVDPGRLFPWKRLADAGFGLWCDAAEIPADAAAAGTDAGEGAVDDALGLRAFGYDTSDIDAARAAFRMHFVSDEAGDEWTDRDRATLACLLEKKEQSRLR